MKAWELDRRMLYMLPTAHGFLFAAVVFVIFLASVNYANGLAYMLTFLLAAVAIVSMLYTHRNLVGLCVSDGASAPVFAGEPAPVQIRIENRHARERLGVAVETVGTAVEIDIAPGATAFATLPLATPRRGYHGVPPITIATRYPLGLLRSWSRSLAVAQRYLVYPKPLALRPLPVSDTGNGHSSASRGRGEHDFAGLRDFQLGDAPSRIHWKAAARGLDLQTKQFTGSDIGTLWLDWDALSGLDTETRLSQLCQWVLDADRLGLRYGVRLPDKVVGPAGGHAHRHQCLEALALFPG